MTRADVTPQKRTLPNPGLKRTTTSLRSALAAETWYVGRAGSSAIWPTSSRHEKKQWQARQRVSARAILPLSNADLEAMFDELDDHLEQEPCDYTLRFTMACLASKGHAAAPVLDWLRDNGGYCDCEVITNARDHSERTGDGSSRVTLSIELIPAAQGGRSTSVSLRGARWRPHLRVSARAGMFRRARSRPPGLSPWTTDIMTEQAGRSLKDSVCTCHLRHSAQYLRGCFN